ncbi:hypothetical protein [Hwanghaeella sp.]|uniref:hypothetical protein n=1 Tax=Hwanghaeella sp. TaxID=2605943 RepID=UPI003CCB86EC
MRSFRNLISATAFLCAVSTSPAAFAVDEYNVSTGTTVSGLGVALRGDDAVALATGLTVKTGQASFTVEHDCPETLNFLHFRVESVTVKETEHEAQQVH